jgi:hypothetical protein
MWRYTQLGIILYTEEWNYVICRKVEGTPVKWNKADWERQIIYVLYHMQKLDLLKNEWQV